MSTLGLTIFTNNFYDVEVHLGKKGFLHNSTVQFYWTTNFLSAIFLCNCLRNAPHHLKIYKQHKGETWRDNRSITLLIFARQMD